MRRPGCERREKLACRAVAGLPGEARSGSVSSIRARLRCRYGAAVFALASLRAKGGARGGGRTHNLQLRRLTLYPIELHAQDKTTIRTHAPLLKWNLQIAAAHCERRRLPGGHRPPLQNTHGLCTQKQKGTARGRPDINHVTPQIIISAEQRVHSCSRLFRCSEAGHWDGACVFPWETFFATYQIVPA